MIRLAGRVSLFYENLGELKMRFLWGMSLSQSKIADCKKEENFAQKNKRKQMLPEQVLDCN